MSRIFRAAVMLPMILLIPLTIGLGGCASKAPAPDHSQGPDSDKIQQDSEKGMQDLQKEEERRSNEY